MNDTERILPVLQAGVFPFADGPEAIVRLDTSDHPDVAEVIHLAATGGEADVQMRWRPVSADSRQGVLIGLRLSSPTHCAFQMVFERDAHLQVLRAAAAAGRFSLTTDDLEGSPGRSMVWYTLVNDELPAMVAALAGPEEN